MKFIRLKPPIALLAAILLAGAVTLLALWCQPNALRSVLSGFLRQPLLIVLNALPIGLLILAGSFLFRNAFFSAALVNLLVCGLSIANRIKIQVRDEPVFPRDFALLKEVGSAMSAYDIDYPAVQIAVVAAVSVLLVLLGLFLRCEPLPFRQQWVGCLLGCGLSLAILAGLIVTVYASKGLYDSFRVSNAYYIPSVFNELGFPYCFCHQFTTYPIDRPEGFSKSEAAGWEAAEAPEADAPAVSVVMVMNEAFSDITDGEMFTYSSETDPLPNLHALRQEPHALSGHVAVPGFAGGTANTEFDVLTGMQTNALSAATTSAFRVVNRNLDSLFRVYAADGYAASFFHPGDNWFYNRENVYRWLGAEETRFADTMTGLEYKGRWVTDDYMAGLIEEAFASAEGPLFHYTTTIQNHMSYTADKYGADYEFPPLETSAHLSQEAETLLRVYVEGVRDADAMLGRLWRYFQAQTEPVVLVFWGDHLPYLGDNQLAYRELGLEIGQEENGQMSLASYETPYVIWANDAAADALDWDTAAASLDLPDGGTVSACFLGAAVLELTGRGEATPWFAFLNQLRREAPVVQKTACYTAGGTPADSPELQEEIARWRRWSYYKLCYKDVP